jgi:hypothetical protein
MGIKHFKASEISPESESGVRVNDALTISTFDKDLQPPVPGGRHLMPCIFVVEKGKPYTYTTLGPSTVYVIEGEFTVEDKSTGIPITFTTGDVSLVDEGTVVTCTSPSSARLFAANYIQAPAVASDGCS